MCESNKECEFESKRDGKDRIYTGSRCALLPTAQTLDLYDTVTLISQYCLMNCGMCEFNRYKNRDQSIVGLKNDLKICEWVSQQKKIKMAKYCIKWEKSLIVVQSLVIHVSQIHPLVLF